MWDKSTLSFDVATLLSTGARQINERIKYKILLWMIIYIYIYIYERNFKTDTLFIKEAVLWDISRKKSYNENDFPFWISVRPW